MAVSEVGVGVVRSQISIWSCWLEALASSSECVSIVTCDMSVNEEVAADWSFVLIDVILAVRESICLR